MCLPPSRVTMACNSSFSSTARPVMEMTHPVSGFFVPVVRSNMAIGKGRGEKLGGNRIGGIQGGAQK